MKIFNRSLSLELMTSASAIFLITLGIVVAQRAGNIVRQVSRGIIPNDAIGTVLTFSLIKLLPLVLSLAIFLAVLLVLSRWHRDSEMVIWFGAGVSLNQFVLPIVRFVLPIVALIALMSLYVMPWATEKSESYREQLKKRDELASISPGAFKESKTGDRIYFVESFDDLGYKIKNVFVQSTQHQKVGIITSDTGSRFKAANGDNFLVLEHGRRYETTPNSAEVNTTDFERYDIRIEVKETTPEPTTTQSKSTSALFRDATAADSAEFQWRLSIPISAMILVLMAIPLSFVDPRAGRSLNVMFAVLIFIIYNNILSIFQAWITQGKLSTSIGLWPVHFIFIGLTLFLFHRRNHLMPIMPAWFKDILIRKTSRK